MHALPYMMAQCRGDNGDRCEGDCAGGREVCGKGMLRWLSRSLFWLRRFNIYAGAWQPRFLVRPLLQVPAVRLAEVLSQTLAPSVRLLKALDSSLLQYLTQLHARKSSRGNVAGFWPISQTPAPECLPA